MKDGSSTPSLRRLDFTVYGAWGWTIIHRVIAASSLEVVPRLPVGVDPLQSPGGDFIQPQGVRMVCHCGCHVDRADVENSMVVPAAHADVGVARE